MAAKFEDDLECSLCLELFAGPVTLQCGHSFCRECIHKHIDASRERDCGDPRCPECRSDIILGEGGVDGLRTNFKLTEIARKFQEIEIPSVPDNQRDSCTEHSQALCLYCDDCEQFLCNMCVSQHPGHRMRGIQSAVDSAKEVYKDKVQQYHEMGKTIMARLTNSKKLQNDLHKQALEQKQEIKRAYDKDLEALNARRKKSEADVEKRYGIEEDKCQKLITELTKQVSDHETLMNTFKEPSSVTGKAAIKDIQDQMARLDVHLPELQTTIGSQKKMTESVGKFLSSATPTQMQLTLTELTPQQIHHSGEETIPKTLDLGDCEENGVQKPVMRFTEAPVYFLGVTEDCFIISQEGRRVTLCVDNYKYGTATCLTDGRLQIGKYYWEVGFYFPNGDGERSYELKAGVVQEGDRSMFGGVTVINTSRGTFSTFLPDTKIKRDVFEHARRNVPGVPVRLGCYLDCTAHVLVYVDVENNEVLAELPFCMTGCSRPLVPALQCRLLKRRYSLAGTGNVHVRLNTGDMCTIPPILLDKINRS